MNTHLNSLTLLALFAAAPALAHNLPLPADTPASFREECASCHLPFAPSLLTADDWKRVMASLDKHFGANATLDDKARREVESFLVRNAATSARFTGVGDPPRLTQTAWFQREHREASSALRSPKVKSAANCVACHTKAEAGSFRENEIAVPR